MSSDTVPPPSYPLGAAPTPPVGVWDVVVTVAVLPLAAPVIASWFVGLATASAGLPT